MTKTNSLACKEFIPSRLCNLKMLFSLGLMKFNVSFLKISEVAELQIFKLSLSTHLSQTEKKFLKKLSLTLIPFKLLEFLVICTLLIVGSSLNKYVRYLFIS